MFCRQCGKENIDGANFCESCGSALGEVAVTNAADESNPFAVGSQTQNASSGYGYDVKAPLVPSGPFSAYKMVISKYCDAKGRASRSEYWYWVLCNFLITIIPSSYFLYEFLKVVAVNPSTGEMEISFEQLPASAWIVFGLLMLYSLFTVCPNICLLIRRLHDFNATGWLALLVTVLSSMQKATRINIGGVLAFVFALIPGTKGPNKYGPQPVKRRST